MCLRLNLRHLKLNPYPSGYGSLITLSIHINNHINLDVNCYGLSKDKFIRVHKSYIINIDKVERFNSKFAEIGVTKIPLSRNKKEDLIKALAIA